MTSPSLAAQAAPIRLCATHGCGHRHGAHYSDDGGSGCEECECGGFQAAPPPPPVEGPGLAEAARALADRAEEAESGVGAMALPDSCEVTVTLGQLRALSAALAAEEARARKDRALRERWRDRLLLARAELVVASQKEAVRRARERIHAVVCELIDGTSEPGSTP